MGPLFLCPGCDSITLFMFERLIQNIVLTDFRLDSIIGTSLIGSEKYLTYGKHHATETMTKEEKVYTQIVDSVPL